MGPSGGPVKVLGARDGSAVRKCIFVLKHNTMKHAYALCAFALLAGKTQAQTIFYEGFDDVSSLAGSGWVLTNLSEPLGDLSWSQADGGLGAIAYSGDTLSYAQSGFQATDANGSGTISDWMVTPQVMLNNGDMIRLFALSYSSSSFPDRIEVRISPDGGSDIGTGAEDVGDFTTLVFTINEDLDTTSFPSLAAGDDWTGFEGAVAGLSGATMCRVGVRYYVTDGGGTGANSSTVGVDDLEVYSGQSSIGFAELNVNGTSVFPNPANESVNVKFGTLKGRAVITVSDMAGQVYSTLTVGEVQQRTCELDTRALANGAYIVTVINEGRSFQQRLVVAH